MLLSESNHVLLEPICSFGGLRLGLYAFLCGNLCLTTYTWPLSTCCVAILGLLQASVQGEGANVSREVLLRCRLHFSHTLENLD